MTLKFYRMHGWALLARLTVRGHIFALNVWGRPHVFGRKSLLWVKHWTPEEAAHD